MREPVCMHACAAGEPPGVAATRPGVGGLRGWLPLALHPSAKLPSATSSAWPHSAVRASSKHGLHTDSIPGLGLPVRGPGKPGLGTRACSAASAQLNPNRTPPGRASPAIQANATLSTPVSWNAQRRLPSRADVALVTGARLSGQWHALPTLVPPLAAQGIPQGIRCNDSVRLFQQPPRGPPARPGWGIDIRARQPREWAVVVDAGNARSNLHRRASDLPCQRPRIVPAQFVQPNQRRCRASGNGPGPLAAALLREKRRNCPAFPAGELRSDSLPLLPKRALHGQVGVIRRAARDFGGR